MMECHNTNNANKALNPDKEIWRRDGKDPSDPGNFYQPRIFTTEDGCIGIECAGLVIIQSVEKWHLLAKDSTPQKGPIDMTKQTEQTKPAELQFMMELIRDDCEQTLEESSEEQAENCLATLESVNTCIVKIDRLKAERDELLEALKRLSLGISEDLDDYPDSSLHRMTMDNLETARAAIAKATGEASDG